MRVLAESPKPPGMGSQGDDVMLVQRALHDLGYAVKPDGIWGNGTEGALQSFARNNSLKLGPKGALNAWAASAMALKLESASVNAAIPRIGNTFITVDPKFFPKTEDSFRAIHGEQDPIKKQLLLNKWLDEVQGFAQKHKDEFDAVQPGWEKDVDLIARYAREAAVMPNGTAELHSLHNTFSEAAKKRLTANIGLISDALRAKDPAAPAEFLDLIDKLAASDPRTAKPVDALGTFLREVEGRNSTRALPPAARRAWVELESTALDAERTGEIRPLAEFTRETFLRHTLEDVHTDPNDPAQVQMTADLAARLKKLEAAADAKAPHTITGVQLRHIVPSLTPARADELAIAVSKAMDQADIKTTRERAAFIAQCAAETGGFQWFHELGPPSYFNKYDNRPDLGNRGHPDGMNFKGRGALQLTGRANYGQFSNWMFKDQRLVKTPERVEQPDLAFESAAWYWMSRGLNRPADANDFKAVTIRINGGTNGWDERVRYYAKALSELSN